jgi:serine/threonine protein kinase
MASPASSTEFLDLVRKSGVLDEKRLDAHVAKLRTTNRMPAEAGKLAGILVTDGLLTHFQAEQIMLGKWRRFTIGKYKVLERLGSGGMGSVYLCEHKLMRRRVAVKVLPTAKASDPAALERFYREARAVAALDHPNIVHAYDIDQDENLHFLVMEYVDGASLQEIIKKTDKAGPMDPLRACHYLYQACLGLQHAHGAGLVHRDIKPGNVLVDRTGVVKILDMGLARFFNDEEDILTKKYDENVLGTADYLAPEQALDSHGVDIRADIYSLGATWYFVLTGRPPFGEGTVAQKLIWHQTRQPKSIRSLRPGVPEALVAIVEKMMAKDAGQRYQTPLAVAEALVPLIESPIGPPPEAEMPRLSLAAIGPQAAETTMVSSSLPTGVSPPPRKNWQVPPSGPQPVVKPAPETRPLSPVTAVPTPQTARVQAATVAKPAPDTAAPKTRPNNGRSAALPAPPAPRPAGEEDSLPWERLTSDTDDPDRADTTSRKNLVSSRPRSGVGPGSRAARERRRFWWVIGGVSAGVIALLVLLFLVLNRHGKEGDAKPAPKVLRVNKVGREGEFRSINKAIVQARKGKIRHIIVAEGRYFERLDLRKVRGLTLEGEGKVVIAPHQSHFEKDPLLTMTETDGVLIKGIEFDGEKRVAKLVSLFGNNPGLILQKVQLINFKDSAMEISNCAGSARNPVQFVELQTVPADPANPKPALVFRFDPSMSDPKATEHIQIDGTCKFDGDYKKSKPIQIEKQPPLKDVTWDGKALTAPGS